jgi:RNA-binding protein YlmH
MENVYQHFRKEEQEFIDSAMDWIKKVEEQYAPYLTPFLDPRQRFILESLAGQYEEVTIHFFGGFEEAERKRAFVSPAYFEPEIVDYQIVLAEIQYPKKFAELSHGQILGSLLGAGIKRETLGDIITDGERWQFLVDEPMYSYLLTEVNQVGRTNIRLEQQPFDSLLRMQDNWEIDTEIVSSLRLDVVLASVFRLSRGKAKELIASGRVKVNWMQVERPDLELDIQDMLSIRGFGRVQIREIQGRTKKDKMLLEIGKLDRNR